MACDLRRSLKAMALTKNSDDDPLSSLTMRDIDSIISSVMDYTKPNAYKMTRLLNNACNEFFKESKIFRRFCYTVDGQRNLANLGNDSVQTLVKSETPWPTIIFKNIDLESGLFSNMKNFDKFMDTNASTLYALQFENCQMSFQRFVEVLAWMKSLRNLSIVNCPGFFIMSHTILNFKALLPHFYQTLSGLRSFTLRDRKLTSETILTFLTGATKLVSLNLQSTSHPLPENIIDLIYRERNTLKILTLSGRFLVDNRALFSLSQLKLQFLSLDRVKIQNTSKFATYFLGKQINLRKLILKNMALDFNVFSDIDKLTRLKSLLFSNCTYKRINEYETLIRFNNVMSLEEISLTNNKYDYKFSCGKELATLFSWYPRENVKILRLTGEDLVSKPILEHLPTNFEYLQVLQLCSGKLNESILQHVWKLKKLTKLVMRFCQLTDLDLLSPLVNLKSLSLCDLRMLKHLDLSFNDISDETIANQVIHLTELRELILSGTKITSRSLDNISPFRDRILPNLESIEFYECFSCVYSPEQSQQLQYNMRPVHLFFDTENKWTKGRGVESDLEYNVQPNPLVEDIYSCD